ncbi:MAG: hypothetical protein ABIU95_10255, partial [Burkholderiales bacterium]
MSRLWRSWWVRIPLALILLAVIVVAWMASLHDEGRLDQLMDEGAWMRIVGLPVAAWAAAMSLVATFGWIARADSREATQRVELAQAKARETEAVQAKATREQAQLSVQVFGAQLIAPITSRGSPLEFTLPRLLNAGPFDPPPETIWAPVVNVNNSDTRDSYSLGLTAQLFLPMRFYYATDDQFFYSMVRTSKQPRLEAIRVFFSSGLAAPIEASAVALRDIGATFALRDFEGRVPPAVTSLPGSPTTGFNSLTEAFAYLEANPSKTCWLAAVDNPAFPKDEQTNEAAVLLILAHRSYRTTRKPIGHLHRPISIPLAKDGRALPSAERVNAFADTLTRAADS